MLHRPDIFRDKLQALFDNYDASDEDRVRSVAEGLCQFLPGNQSILNTLIDLYDQHPELFGESLTKEICQQAAEAQIERLRDIAISKGTAPDSLALLVQQALQTPHEDGLVGYVASNEPHRLEVIIEDKDKEDRLVNWILFDARLDEAAAVAVRAYIQLDGDPESIQQRGVALFVNASVNRHISISPLKRLYPILGHVIRFNNLETESEELSGCSDAIWKEMHLYIQSLKALLTACGAEGEVIPWKQVDYESILEKDDPIFSIQDFIESFCLLLSYGMSIPKEILTSMNNLRERMCVLETRNRQIGVWESVESGEEVEVGEVMPIAHIKGIIDSLETFVKIQKAQASAERLSASSRYENLQVVQLDTLFSCLRWNHAMDLHGYLNDLARATRLKAARPESPHVEQVQLFDEVLAGFFPEGILLPHQDYEVIKATLSDLFSILNMPESVQLDIRHRHHSGPSRADWEAAPQAEKYVIAYREDDRLGFAAMPLLRDVDGVMVNDALKEKALLALLTSFFYHLKTQGWGSEVCIELRKNIAQLCSDFEPDISEEDLLKKYQELEQVGYYGECPSEDSEDERIERFAREPIRIRNVLLTAADQMMVRGQVNNIWVSDGHKFREPKYPGRASTRGGEAKSEAKDPTAVTFYDVTARAEIHHGEAIPVEVQNDLSLLNEHALHGALSDGTLKEINTRFMVAQYRGIHYDTSGWSQRKRRQHRKHDFQDDLYSPAVFAKAGIPLEQATSLSVEQSVTLQQQAQLLFHQVASLEHSGAVSGSLSDGSTEVVFNHAGDALQDFYTKKYDAHRDAFAGIKGKKDSHAVLDRPIDVAMLFSTGSHNYLNSTGDTPYHPMRYALGLKSYGRGKDKRLRPRWNQKGKSERPYSGRVYLFLLGIEAYLQLNPRHVVSLNHQRRIAIDARIVAERETSFPAAISQKHIVESRVMRYPNFSGPYREYYQHEYGLNQKLYEQFQRDLLLGGPHSVERKRAKFLLGEHLCAYHEACLVEDARQLARRQGAWLIYRDRTGGFCLMPPRLVPNTDNPADAALQERQRLALSRRISQNPDGWLQQFLQQNTVIAGNGYRDALEHFCERVRELPPAESAEAGSDWLSRIKGEFKSSFTDYVKTYFSQSLNEMQGLANRANLRIRVESFLFCESIVLTPVTVVEGVAPTEVMLLYMGGDGFYGFRPRIPVAASAAPSTSSRQEREGSSGDKRGPAEQGSRASKQQRVVPGTLYGYFNRKANDGGAEPAPS